MNTRVRNHLIYIAKNGGTPIPYTRLVNQTELGLDLEIKHEKQLLGEILDEISTDEHKAGRPLLSAMVQDKRTGQGDRFFKLCEKLGVGGDWRELKKDEAFRNDHTQKCLDFWQDEVNYKKFF